MRVLLLAILLSSTAFAQVDQLGQRWQGTKSHSTHLRTNVLLQSENLGTSPWGAFDTVVTDGNAVAPNGTTTAALVNVLGDNFAGTVYQSLTLAGVQTGYMWLRMVSGTATVYLAFGDGAGTYYKTTAALTTTWKLFAVTTPALASGTWFFSVGYDTRDATQVNPGAVNIYAWGGQVNSGSAPACYVHTTTTSAGRRC